MASALRGIRHAARTQRHLRAHLVIAAVLFLAAVWVGLDVVELAIVAGTIGLVVAAELLNTAVETLTDLLHPDAGPRAALVKDVSAAAVLTTTVVAAAIAAFIFLPHFFLLFLPRFALATPALTRGFPIVLALVCLAALWGGIVRGRRPRG